MQTDTIVVSLEHRTGGMWTHAGRLRVRFEQSNGTVQTITLPDDLVALQARVSALEASMGTSIDALEDLKYGN